MSNHLYFMRHRLRSDMAVPVKNDKPQGMQLRHLRKVSSIEVNLNEDTIENEEEKETYELMYVEPNKVLEMINQEQIKSEFKREAIEVEVIEEFECGISDGKVETNTDINISDECTTTANGSSDNDEKVTETAETSNKQKRSEKIEPPFSKRFKRSVEFPDKSTGRLLIDDPSMQLIVTCKGSLNDEFTDERVTDFLAAVGDLVSENFENGTIAPQFNPMLWDRKHLLITASNHMSKQWLIKHIRSIRPWGKPIRLFAFDPMRKFVVIVPYRKYKTNQEILDLLDIQNPGLFWSERKIWERIEKPGRVGIVFLMDFVSMDVSGSMNPSPFYSCSRAKFALYSGQTTEQPLFLS